MIARGKTPKSKGRKTTRAAPSIADLQKQVDVLTRELKEANERQTATAEVLQVINSSTGHVEPVFAAMLKKATQLCEAAFGILWLTDGEQFQAAASHGVPAAYTEIARKPISPLPTNPLGRMLRGERLIVSADVADEESYRAGDSVRRALVDLGGARSVIQVALIKDDVLLGSLTVYRQEVRPFSEKQIALLQNFAAQAVIAIENARLFNETQQALEQQTATAEILRVISQSPADVRPVFDSIVLAAVRLLQCDRSFFLRCDRTTYSAMSIATFENGLIDVDSTRRLPVDPAKNFPSRVITEKKTLYLPDISLMELPRHERRVYETYGNKSGLFLPLIRGEECIGILVFAGKRADMFGEREIALAESFREQALIAIENARLFNEVQAKTRDLEESLQQQTATADVLKVISRSAFDLRPVLNTLVKSATELCSASMGVFYLRQGDLFHLATEMGAPQAFVQYLRDHPVSPDRSTGAGRAALSGKVEHVPDVLADPDYQYGQHLGGYRSLIAVPLLRGGDVIGVFTLSRFVAEAFTPRQIELVTTFTDQAVIAIENARLFNETKEALERQTATADILKVIASSPDDVQPVFQAIAERSKRLIDALSTTVFTLIDGMMHLRAFTPITPEADATLQAAFPAPLSTFSWGASIKEGKLYAVIDAEQESELRDLARERGWRSCLCVPLMRDGKPIGMIGPTRAEPGPFTDHHVQLMQTFADQAVIAIENTRLFNEVQAKTRDLEESLQQQTATADVLKVISRSTFDLPAVLHALVETAARLCDGEKATITRQKDGVFFRAEAYGFSDEFMDYARTVPIIPDRGSVIGRALLGGVVVHIPDVKADPDYTFSEGQKLGDFRTVLGVPMLREGVPIGVIVLTRSEARPFTDKQIELATTFADQAAIAIENVRLFDEVQERTRELSQSLDDLRNAQDRLIQTEKLASLGQLTAGIAHEIKNPLNFVNNFSALSVELTDELNDLMRQATLAEQLRKEVDEVTGLLKDNLTKVVQHGKRADSIVKNMLLHSREGSGEHRPTDINTLVEESLNLAYHGARAEGRDFNITLERDFDHAGLADIYPQEITRALLNLISNGFYAATKHAAASSNGFEPKLKTTTRNLGDRIEIRIRDNGMGIPPDIREKIFNPFFTTKPAGEGTGLGLSMSHDIVVKQHGGAIDVVTEPGSFTEFIITLPRVMP
jgi:GAF domain-containing protein